jgi:hypothetical protein
VPSDEGIDTHPKHWTPVSATKGDMVATRSLRSSTQSLFLGEIVELAGIPKLLILMILMMLMIVRVDTMQYILASDPYKKNSSEMSSLSLKPGADA